MLRFWRGRPEHKVQPEKVCKALLEMTGKTDCKVLKGLRGVLLELDCKGLKARLDLQERQARWPDLKGQ
jgi:hypothetical protein